MRPDHIYKVFRPAEWQNFEKDGVFKGSPDDIRDGYIHLSTTEHLQGTLDKYYTDGQPIVLAEVDARLEAVKAQLKYETARAGAEFPHIYGTLARNHVTRIWELDAEDDMRFALPAEIFHP